MSSFCSAVIIATRLLGGRGRIRRARRLRQDAKIAAHAPRTSRAPRAARRPPRLRRRHLPAQARHLHRHRSAQRDGHPDLRVEGRRRRLHLGVRARAGRRRHLHGGHRARQRAAGDPPGADAGVLREDPAGDVARGGAEADRPAGPDDAVPEPPGGSVVLEVRAEPRQRVVLQRALRAGRPGQAHVAAEDREPPPVMRRAAAFLAALVVLLAYAADRELRVWPIPGRGKLAMIVPTDWYDDPRGAPGGLPRLRYFDRLGARPPFDMTVTIAWSSGKEASFKDPARVRAFVAQSAEDLASAAVEKRFPLREIKGEYGIGYLFQATLQSPAQGAWPNLTQGAYVVGDLLLAFSIVTAEPKSLAVEQAIEMLATAQRTQ